MRKIKAYVINHGHMDVEWYQPLSSYGHWFCESIDMLYDIVQKDNDYRCYVYDGVVFPVLYAIGRDKSLKCKVERLIADDKLKIGPFYTQFDEFLTSGEGIIKNCLWGDRKCRELKTETMKAGYFLDNFGHPEQLPQILNNFKIKSLFFSRGMCDIGNGEKEFVFRSPDGSEICAQNISYTFFRIYANNDPRPSLPNYLPYYKNEYFTYEYYVDISKHIDHIGIANQLIDGVREAARYYPSGIVPVFAGSDHCPPQEGISETLAIANEIQDDIEFIFTDAEKLSESLNKVSQNMATFSGNLIGSRFDLLLFGAMTTRIYLKQSMYSCEHLLFDYALPLAAYTKYFGEETTQNSLDEATQLLLVNSTHDSIHGSSVDSVHREMEYRFDLAKQLSVYSIHDSMQKLAKHLESSDLSDEIVVYSPYNYDGYVSAWVYAGSEGVVLTDHDGNVYDNTVVPQKEIAHTAKNKPYYLRPVSENIREIVFKAKLNAGQVKKLYYRSNGCSITEITPKNKGEIHNEFFSLTIKDGHLDLTDNVTNRKMSDFLIFTEEADTGDAFDFSSPWCEAKTYSSDMFGYTDMSVLNCGLYQQLTAKCLMRVPLETVGDKRSDSMVDMPLTVEFKLWKGIKRLDINIKISNYSKNHRVRAVFAFPMDFSTVKANETFCSHDFPIQRPQMTADWWEEPTRELPFRDWVSVSDGDGRWTVSAKGLYVFEPIDGRRLAFTLFRSIGELMRINLKNRAGCCASGYPVNSAQSLRDMSFDFSLYLHDPEESAWSISNDTAQFISPPAVHTLRRSLQVRTGNDSVELYKFIDNDSFIVSVFELTYDGNYYLLRFYESSSAEKTAKINLSAFEKVYMSDMNESIGEELQMDEGIIHLTVQPNKVITLLMR